jgi:hypothetical protein
VCQTISTRADLATTFFFAAQATFALILSPYFYQRSVASPQLGDIRRHPPRLTPREQLGRRSPAGLILEIDIRKRLAAVVAHDEAPF